MINDLINIIKHNEVSFIPLSDGNIKVRFDGSACDETNDKLFIYDGENGFHHWLNKHSSIVELELINQHIECPKTIKEGLFSHLKYIRSIRLINIMFKSNEMTNKPLNVSYMFNDCKKLVYVELSHIKFQTNTIIQQVNMSNLFNSCVEFKDFKFEAIHCDNLIDLSGMFAYCINLKYANLSPLHTLRHIKSLSSLFYHCRELKGVHLIGLNTDDVESFWAMFEECESLPSVNISTFKTSKCKNFESMFHGCKNLVNLTLPTELDTSRAEKLSYMFKDCEKLEHVDTHLFNTSNCSMFTNMFANCLELKDLDLRMFDTSNGILFNDMFVNCKCLTSLDLSDFDFKNANNLSSMFAFCSSLQDLKLNIPIRFVGPMLDTMFEGCNYLGLRPWMNANSTIKLVEF